MMTYNIVYVGKHVLAEIKLSNFLTVKRTQRVKMQQTRLKRPLSKRPKIGFQDQLSSNAGQKYCRMLQGEHSAILSTFI